MKRVAIYPGSFDPPTLAHFNIYRQALEVFDEVVVVVAKNASKSKYLLDIGEKEKAWKSEFNNVDFYVAPTNESIIQTCTRQLATHIVRGIRGPGDVEPEHAFYDFVCRNSGKKIVYFTVPAYLRSCSSTRIRSVAGLVDWKSYVVKDTTDAIVDIIANYGNF